MLPFWGGKESGGPVHTWWCKACFVPTALGSSLPPGETEESTGRVMGKGFALKQPPAAMPKPAAHHPSPSPLSGAGPDEERMGSLLPGGKISAFQQALDANKVRGAINKAKAC